MPNIHTVFCLEEWPPLQLTNIHSADSNTPSFVLNDDEDGWIEMKIGQPGITVGGDVKLSIPEESYSIFADTNGRLIISIPDEPLVKRFLTQPLRLRAKYTPVALYVGYNDGLLKITVNNYELLLDSEADGKALLLPINMLFVLKKGPTYTFHTDS